MNERVALYKNAQRILSADKDLKISEKKEKCEDMNLNFKSLKKQSLNDVKTKLASKINLEKLKIDQNYSNDNDEDSNENNINIVNLECPEIPIKKISCFTLKALLENLKNNSKTNLEQNKRYITTRKVFSDLEREKAKNFSNKSKNIQYMNELKDKKEKIRLIEELYLEIQNVSPPNLTTSDYIVKEAPLKKLPRSSILKKKVSNTNTLPLCQCKSFRSNNFEINECASNCIFYKNNIGNLTIFLIISTFLTKAFLFAF